MKKSLALFAALAMSLAGEVVAQTTVTSQTTASAQIAAGLTLIRNADLDFGAMISPSAQGTVRIAALAAGTPTYTGITGVPSTTSAAAFSAAQTNPGNTHFWINLPQQIYICNGACTPTTRMLVNAFTAQSAVPPALNQAACVSVGAAIAPGPRGQCPDAKRDSQFLFYVGATLTVPAAQGPGLYSGTFNVTINAF